MAWDHGTWTWRGPESSSALPGLLAPPLCKEQSPLPAMARCAAGFLIFSILSSFVIVEHAIDRCSPHLGGC